MISIIAAIDKNFVIGHAGRIPWHLPEDLKLFKRLTTGHVVIMGRKTFDSLPPNFKPLPNRQNIVVSSAMAGTLGVIVCRSYEEAIERARTLDDQIFVIGGRSMYETGIRNADRLLISHVEGDFVGDVYFPKFSENEWTAVNKTQYNGFVFVEYERKQQFKH